MSAIVHRIALVIVLLSVVTGSAEAQRPPKKRAAAKTKWIVVQNGDEISTADASSLKQLQKQADQDYKDAVRSWTEAKKAAKKAKERFTDKKPVKQKVKKLGGPYRSEAEAEQALRKFRAARSKASARRSGGSSKGAWTVVEVDGDRRVIEKKALAALKKQLAADHRAAVKEWTAAKAAARKSKEKFDRKKPAAPKVKPLGKSFASEEAAREWAASAKK